MNLDQLDLLVQEVLQDPLGNEELPEKVVSQDHKVLREKGALEVL